MILDIICIMLELERLTVSAGCTKVEIFQHFQRREWRERLLTCLHTPTMNLYWKTETVQTLLMMVMLLVGISGTGYSSSNRRSEELVFL